jgi:hypothetical protein
MKLLALLLTLAVTGQAQSILRNSLDTNVLSTNLVWNPSTKRLRLSGATPSIELWNTSGTANFRRFLFNNASDQLRVEWSNDAGNSALLLSTWSSDGNFSAVSASLSGTTNRLTISNNTLLMDGVAVGGSTSTNYYSTIITTNMTVLNSLTVSNISVTNITVQNNLIVSNLYTVNGNHNTLIVTQALTLGTLKTNLLAVTATGLVTNANYGSGITWTPSTLTLSASASGGASVWVPNTALTYSGGTNLTIDGSGGTNFFVLLTNTAFFTTPANIPADKSTNMSFTVFFQQDSSGSRAVTWTNASFKWPGASQFQPSTNASAVSWVSFIMSPFTNSIFMGDYGVLDSR